jgi:hypothetical protein
VSTLNTRYLFVAILTVLSAPFSRAHANANAIDLPWRAGMELGKGLDSATLSFENLNVALDPATTASDKLGPAVCPFERKFDMELVDSVTEYERKIGVTAEAEINVIVASATGTLSFAEQSIHNSESVYLMIRDERVNCHSRLKAPKLTPGAETKFATDYPAFRAQYGDRFLSTVSTGGNFYAVMEVKKNHDETHDELMFKLKAKVMGVTVFSWGMEKAFDDVTDGHETVISVYSNNSQYLTGVTKERMFELYAEYLGIVTSPACSAKPATGQTVPQSPFECPYRRASYEDYQQLTRYPAGSSAQQGTLMSMLAQQTAVMDELAQRRRGYADIEARAADVEAHIADYAYPRAQDEAIKLQKVQQLRGNAHTQAASLLSAYNACVSNALACTPPGPTTPSEMALEREFPVERSHYPQSCKEFRDRYDLRRDTAVQLYWQGKRAQPFDAFCTQMGGADPQTYLLFRVSSPSTVRPDVNFARRIGTPDATFSEARTVTSVLAGLHVRFANGQVVVLPQEGGLVTDLGGPIPDGALDITHAEVFAVQTCDAPGERHLANLSLQGTPWAISTQNVKTIVVPPGSEGTWIVSADNKQLDAYGEGRTGCVRLSFQGSLLLEYQP